MTDTSRGRAHLEQLLNRAEKVVRVSPVDTIVLMGVADVQHAEEFAPLAGLLQQEGIEAAGVLVLGEGVDLDSVDMTELTRAYLATAEAVEGSEFRIIGRVELTNLTVPCPRCSDVLPIPVHVMVGDDGSRMMARAVAEQTDLDLHGMVCAGQSTTDV